MKKFFKTWWGAIVVGIGIVGLYVLLKDVLDVLNPSLFLQHSGATSALC